MPRKKFDKKNAVTFKLVNRSQRDPLIADETAPQNVLVELNNSKPKANHQQQFADGPSGSSAPVVDTRKTEQRKYGIYYDDDYDYMQHLKTASDFAIQEHEWEPVTGRNGQAKDGGGSSKLLLPSSVFPSKYQEDEGMLNKAVLPVGPQPDWDPDIVAAMDDDFDFDDPNNQMEDDFFQQALATEEGELQNDNEAQVGQSVRKEKLDSRQIGGSSTLNHDDPEDSDQEYSSDFSDEDEGEHGERQFDEEETKSHFTNYSMTSSVMRRNKGLTLLDERFETLYENEYGNDTEIGALDAEEIEGYVPPNDSRLQQLIDEFNQGKQNAQYEAEKMQILGMVESDEQMVTIEIDDSGKNREDRFDCESILSTYSNLYNHPKLIYEPKVKSNKITINSASGIPVGVLGKPRLTEKKLRQLDMMDQSQSGVRVTAADMRSLHSTATKLSQLSLRPKDETLQERKARKCQLKAFRKERRLEKKANQLAFKQEELRQHQELKNIRQNLSGVKLV